MGRRQWPLRLRAHRRLELVVGGNDQLREFDGEVVTSCMTLAFDVRGKQVTTIEGLASGEKLHPVQQAFVDHDALQCGFCTPGMVMSCAALVERDPNCTVEDVKTAVSGHLCRCGTYPNILKATLAAARGWPQNQDSGKGGRR